jgi:hypothetical protein
MKYMTKTKMLANPFPWNKTVYKNCLSYTFRVFRTFWLLYIIFFQLNITSPSTCLCRL